MVNNNLNNVICSKTAKNIFLLLFILACVPSFAQQKSGKAVAVDTFKLANQHITKKKFRRAAKLYNAYHQYHPKDLNSLWKLAQTKFWLNNFRQSDTLYRSALKLNPENDYLRLNYIHSLLDMGRTAQAASMLTDMELAGKDYSDMAFLRAKLYFYEGDYDQAAAYMRKSLSAENNNSEAHELDEEIALARSPLVSLSSGYLSDNQPVTSLVTTLKAENYFNKYADLYIICDEYHFMQDVVSDAPWVRVGDKLFFPKAGLHVNVGAGVFRYPVKNGAGVSGYLSLNEKISPHFDIDVSADHTPYFDTKTSIDTDIHVTKVAAMLNWHLRNWSAQAAVLNSTYPDNNNVYGAYGWVLAPIISFPHGQLLAGYSISYSNSNHSSYTAVDSLPEIIANYATNPNIAGVYNPYFTPNELFTNSGLIALNLTPSKKISINLSGDVGYGSINAPYLFLNKNDSGKLFVDRGFAIQKFIPIDAKVAINYHIDNTWLLSAKYNYTTTYFFTSNYISLGIQKSFQHHGRRDADGTGSTFSRLINEMDEKIQGLYKSEDENDLRNSVGYIRGQLVKLRDAQKNRKNSETLLGSDETATLLDRYDNLNEMIEEIDAVDLNDYKTSAKSKKEWLVDKLYELTSITYSGNRD